MGNLTPMMEQYMEIKNRYKEALLFFRLGDFYELFFDDAKIASRELEITLTGRDCGLEERAPMCGVPYHSVNSYIDKLISKGYKVAICEQIEDPSQAKGIVKRDVIRVITPGTLIDTNLLEEKKNNYLASLYISGSGFGLSYVDISTGELFCTEGKHDDINKKLMDEMAKIEATELIYYIENNIQKEMILDLLTKRFNMFLSQYDSWTFETEYAINQIKNHFHVMSIDGLGFHKDHLGIQTTGALLDYLEATQKRSLAHINKINLYSLQESMILDMTTRRNLELTETMRGKSKKGSLLWVLDRTLTAMGGRKLRKWIEQPLLDVRKIKSRLESVGILKENILLRMELKENLKQVYDLERLSGKIAFGSVNPRDLIALKKSLTVLPDIKLLFNDHNKKDLLKHLIDQIDCLEDICQLVEISIVEDPPLSIKEGGFIKDGYNKGLDELYNASRQGKSWIAELENKEKEKTNIKSLKVGYNKVFGYYIEVTKSNLSLVPDRFIRKQTLSNCERYITPELKEIENKVLGAEEKIISLEYELFLSIKEQIGLHIDRIQKTAQAIAELDAIFSLAESAAENNYIKPQVKDNDIIHIQEGRHPVVEKMLEGERFVANDTYLDQGDNHLLVITGPNMAGKSTYMRQVALIVLMAQIGSFVPADAATIGIVDRIFTRVGASDDLSQGQSTFMVEMSEMANIINSATERSLLIVDEIGRGTSTFDGLSIAWAVTEYINRFLKARTLFSTHYHELTELEGKLKGIVNYRVSVQENKDDIVFLHKVVKGSADRSYGIQVAKLAGLPQDIIDRANYILHLLEKKDESTVKIDDIEKNSLNEQEEKTINKSKAKENKKELVQIDFHSFVQEDLIKDLTSIDLLDTTPLEAINILYKLQKKAENLLGGL